MNTELEKAGVKLADATRSGNLAAAYRVLDKRPVKDVAEIALRAGFSCISQQNRRDFMVHVIRQVAEAARNRTDGYGLRTLPSRSPQVEDLRGHGPQDGGGQRHA